MRINNMEIIIDIRESDFDFNNTISLPMSLYDYTDASKCGKLKVGMTSIDVNFTWNYSENTVKLPKFIINKLNLSKGLKTNVKLVDNVLSIGPVIGVFTSNGAIKKAMNQTPNFRMTELCKCNVDVKTILYYFSIKDVDFINKEINGIYFNEYTNKFEQKPFPLPDVLYDRGGGFLSHQRIISNYIRNQLNINNNMKKINSQYYFDKWDVHERLYNYEEMRKYLPHTIKFKHKDDISYMLNQTDSLYFKDRFGSNGMGVIKINKVMKDSYEISFFNDKLNIFYIDSYEKLLELLIKQSYNKKIIIQKTIDLITYEGRSVDLRATVQRNINGEIDICAYPVRVAVTDSPITSTKSGSTVYKFEDFFKKLMHYNEIQIEELKNRIDEFLLIAYNCIEKSYGSFGEIGIDFALDKYNRLWFIECNAKPGKDTLYKSYESEIVKKSFINPLYYGMYLTEFYK